MASKARLDRESDQPATDSSRWRTRQLEWRTLSSVRYRLAWLTVSADYATSTTESRLGTSIFWMRESMIPDDTDDMMREFLDNWQTKRDGKKRGIVEIKP